MTSEKNFYRRTFYTVGSYAMQYCGLMIGVWSVVVADKELKDDPTSMIIPIIGFGAYLIGKGLECARQQEVLNNSFNRLEEIILEKLKKND